MNFTFRYPITFFRLTMIFLVLFLCLLTSLIIILPVFVNSNDIKTSLEYFFLTNVSLVGISLVVYQKWLLKYFKTRRHKSYFEIADHGFSLPSIYLFPSSYSLMTVYVSLSAVSSVKVFKRQKEIHILFYYESLQHTLKLKPEYFVCDEDYFEIESYFKYYCDTLS